MHKQRLDYEKIAPEGYKAFGLVHRYVGNSGLDPLLIDLVYLRVSQINGCAYCVDLHSRDALAKGVDQRKLNNLATYWEAPFFTKREQVALAWADSLTRVAETRAPDADYDAAHAEFGDKGMVDLTYAVALMNAFNRLGVAFRLPLKL